MKSSCDAGVNDTTGHAVTFAGEVEQRTPNGTRCPHRMALALGRFFAMVADRHALKFHHEALEGVALAREGGDANLRKAI